MHKILDDNLRFPLSWPGGQVRTPGYKRNAASFGKTTIAVETHNLGAELARMGVREWLISSNMKMRQDGLPYSNQVRIEDPGVAVYFEFRQRAHCLACDRWDTVEHNLRAIVKHIDAMRGQSRWGVGTIEQAFAGYAALPPARHERPRRAWNEVLGVAGHEATDAVKARYRALVKVHHPDCGGDSAVFQEVQQAFDEFKAARGITS